MDYRRTSACTTTWLPVEEDKRARNAQKGQEAIGSVSNPVEKGTSTTDYHGLPWSKVTMEYHGLLLITVEHYRLPQNIMEYHGLIWNSISYRGIPWTVVEYHRLMWSTTGYRNMDCRGASWTSVEYHRLPRSIVDCRGMSQTIMDYFGLS